MGGEKRRELSADYADGEDGDGRRGNFYHKGHEEG